MEIRIIREVVLAGGQIFGRLYVDGVYRMDTLERKGVEIPSGKYPVVVSHSPHFNRDLPHIQEIPDRTAIEIHAGNLVGETRGCVLVGRTRNGPAIFGSLSALAELMKYFETVAPGVVSHVTVENP